MRISPHRAGPRLGYKWSTARTSLDYKRLHSAFRVQSGHSLQTGNINFNPLLPSSRLDVVREAKLRPSLGLAVQDFSSMWAEFTVPKLYIM